MVREDLLTGSVNLLPDSRLRTIVTPKDAVPTANGYLVPIFCASCGTKGGLVPEQNMTFAFWLCTPCFKQYGELTNTYVMPDEVFWAKLAAEQLETHGRLLSNDELVAEVQAAATPLAKLIQEGRSP